MLEADKIGAVIRMHRKAAGLSQLELAEMAGVGKTLVFDIEKGKESIRLDSLQKILKVLNIELKLSSHLLDNS